MLFGNKVWAWCRALYDRAPAITLRKYAPYLVAEVNAEGGTMKEAISDGFRQACPGDAKQLSESHCGMPVEPSLYGASTQSLIT